MHFYLKVEGRGAWVLFIHFLLLLYFVNLLLVFLTFEGGKKEWFFSTLEKKKFLKGVVRGFFFSLTFCYSFIIWKFFLLLFVYSGRGRWAMSFFLVFLFSWIGKWVWILLFHIFTFSHFLNSWRGKGGMSCLLLLLLLLLLFKNLHCKGEGRWAWVYLFIIILFFILLSHFLPPERGRVAWI